VKTNAQAIQAPGAQAWLIPVSPTPPSLRIDVTMEERRPKEQCRLVARQISTPLSDWTSSQPDPICASASCVNAQGFWNYSPIVARYRQLRARFPGGHATQMRLELSVAARVPMSSLEGPGRSRKEPLRPAFEPVGGSSRGCATAFPHTSQTYDILSRLARECSPVGN